LAAGLSVILWVFPFEPAAAYAVGLLAGTLLSAVKVALMERSLNRAADIGEFTGARNYGVVQVMLRNMLTLGFFLLVFFFRPVFGLFGAIAGILALQPAALITGYVLRKNSTQV
ncbi:MAG: hypothetical protein FWH49_05540, partial [Clostridiales bacterium]|nr:hypothetical protein [Clostridiales bacterium]